MSEETVAASSPADVDVFQGKEVSFHEFSRYRDSGELPERFKQAEPAEPAPAEEPAEPTEGEEPETALAAEPETTQEPPQKGAEKRIKQLLAKTKELERQLAAKQGVASDPPPERQQPPQNYQDYRKAFNPTQWVEEYAKANPQASYEEANAAMVDHLSDAREHFRSIETRVKAERDAVEAKATAARERYQDFDEIKESFLDKVLVRQSNGTLSPAIPLQVLGIINDSEVMPDLLYTIGSDEAELAKFVEMAKTNPNKAIRYVAKVESLIAEELAKPKTTPARGEDGKFATTAPEPRKTQAPKPPSPVGGGSSRVFDVTDDTTPINDWWKARNAQLAKK